MKRAKWTAGATVERNTRATVEKTHKNKVRRLVLSRTEIPSSHGC